MDRRFIGYVLELTDGVTGRVVDLLHRAALHALTMRSQRIGLAVLQHVGARLPTRSLPLTITSNSDRQN